MALFIHCKPCRPSLSRAVNELFSNKLPFTYKQNNRCNLKQSPLLSFTGNMNLLMTCFTNNFARVLCFHKGPNKALISYRAFVNAYVALFTLSHVASDSLIRAI